MTQLYGRWSKRISHLIEIGTPQISLQICFRVKSHWTMLCLIHKLNQKTTNKRNTDCIYESHNYKLTFHYDPKFICTVDISARIEIDWGKCMKNVVGQRLFPFLYIMIVLKF